MSSTAAGPLSIVMEREIPYPPEKIWRALTQQHLIEEWLMSNDFKPIVGHRFTLRSEPQPHWNGVTDCEVLAVEPNKTLSYTWNSSGDEAASGLKTIVTWTLTPTGTGTHLRMEQSGFRPDQQQNYRGAQYGWQHFLAALEQVASSENSARNLERAIDRDRGRPQVGLVTGCTYRSAHRRRRFVPSARVRLLPGGVEPGGQSGAASASDGEELSAMTSSTVRIIV